MSHQELSLANTQEHPNYSMELATMGGHRLRQNLKLKVQKTENHKQMWHLEGGQEAKPLPVVKGLEMFYS